MNKFIGIILGLVCLSASIYAWIVNFAGVGTAALTFLKGGLMWMLILVGAVSLIVGLASLKE